jgi:hypothetical protein
MCEDKEKKSPNSGTLDGIWQKAVNPLATYIAGYNSARNEMVGPVEGLHCKRPIQCLASSEILTPHPLTAPRVCTGPPLVRGEDTLARGRGGGGSIVWKTSDTALHSIYVSTLWWGRTIESHCPTYVRRLKGQ